MNDFKNFIVDSEKGLTVIKCDNCDNFSLLGSLFLNIIQLEMYKEHIEKCTGRLGAKD